MRGIGLDETSHSVRIEAPVLLPFPWDLHRGIVRQTDVQKLYLHSTGRKLPNVARWLEAVTDGPQGKKQLSQGNPLARCFYSKYLPRSQPRADRKRSSDGWA